MQRLIVCLMDDFNGIAACVSIHLALTSLARSAGGCQWLRGSLPRLIKHAKGFHSNHDNTKHAPLNLNPFELWLYRAPAPQLKSKVCRASGS